MKKDLTQPDQRYTPQLPEEEINKIVQELSDPNLSPVPYSVNRAQELINKIAGLTNEYNHKIIEIIENERKEAFEAGKKEGKK
jgi:hypothetical protein